MRRKVFVPLLVPVCNVCVKRFRLSAHYDTVTRTVFRDVMEVVPTNDNGTGHLGRDDAPCENATAD